MTFTQIRNYIKGLFNPIVDELKQDIEDANNIVPINYDDFKNLPQSEKDNGKAYFVPDVNFSSEKVIQTGFTPIGTIISVMGNHAPSHYLICDGSTYNISQYSDLATYFEQEFGSKNYFGGDGTTTFAVPDLRGEFLRGTGTNSHANNGSGSNVGVHQDATQMPNMYTSISSDATKAMIGSSITKNVTGAANYGISKPDAPITITDYGKYLKATNMVDLQQSSANHTIAYTIRPTNTSVLYCIATCNIYIDTKNSYSTQETVIGEWIDGKPLYQKTIEVSYEDLQPALNNTSTNQNVKDISNLNIDNLADYKILMKQYNGTNQFYYYKSPMVTPQFVKRIASGNTNPGMCFNFWIRDNNIGGQTEGFNTSWMYMLYVTLQYTKTTD